MSIPVRILTALLFVFSFNSYSLSQVFTESVPIETALESSPSVRTQQVWLEMIHGAKKTLDIETFYFSNKKGEPLDTILTSIKDAAKRGVKVRILIDRSFYENNDKSSDELEGVTNIEIRKVSFKNTGGVMHAKFFIADSVNVFIGSQNFDWRALKHIHETGVRIDNAVLAKDFLSVFERDWKSAGGDDNYSASVTLSPSNPLEFNSDKYGKIELYPLYSPVSLVPEGGVSEEEGLARILNTAKNTLDIQMYSYSPKDRSGEEYLVIDNLIRSAAKRGVKVRIIFSNWAIRKGATEFIQDLSEVQNVEVKFSNIPVASEGYIPFARVEHCKYFVADGSVSWISTSNWSKDYFYNSRNLTIVINNDKFAEEVETAFERSWTSPYAEKVDANGVYEPVKRN